MRTKTAIRCIILFCSLLGASLPAWSASPLIISEFRVRGPGGASDEFIEIYNNSGSAHTVTASTGTGYGIAASDGILRCTIGNGTIISNHGHFLCANTSFGDSAYPASDTSTATANMSFTTDIPDNAGIALFSTDVPADFALATRFDAVGSTSEANTLYKEGTGYPALSPFSIDYSFSRDACGKGGSVSSLVPCTLNGGLADTDNNATDFIFNDTNGTSAGAGQRLGTPGPESISGPITGGTTSVIPDVAIDSCSQSLDNTSVNFVRDFTSVPALNSTFGTIDVRRTYTNNTGAPLTRLRFRIVDLSTFPAPSGVADLRPRTSSDVSVNVDRPPCGSGNSSVMALGTTLEEPPSQPNGGGFNSSLSVPSVTTATPLATGATVDLHFLFGIQQTGDFHFGLAVEGLPVGGGTEDFLYMTCGTDTSCVAPSVVSSVRVNPSPTALSSVDYTVTFDQSVTGVDAADFALTTTGTIAGASITNVAGSGTTRTVTVNTGTGNGTIRLDLADDDSIVNATFQPLGDVGAGNGNFTTGETYTINKTGATVSFSNASFAVGESAGTATITVIRSGDVSSAIGVDVGTSNGTATSGSDYTTTTTTLNWVAGDTGAKTFTVPILSDVAVEGDETVNLTLSNPTGGAVLGSPSTAVLTIVDNDDVASSFGSFNFSAASYSVNESGGNAIITVVRSGGSNGAVSVTITSSNGTATAADYTAATTVLNWASGDTGVKTFTVPILPDTLTEGNETVNLTLSAPGGGAVLGSPSSAVLTIVDVPQVPINIDNGGGAISPWTVLYGLMAGLLSMGFRRRQSV